MQEGLALQSIKAQRDLGVRMAVEGLPLGYKLSAQLGEIEDLAVEDDGVTPAIVHERLVPGDGGIDDAQAAMAQDDPADPRDAVIVRPSMRDAAHGRNETLLVNRLLRADPEGADYAAHGGCIVLGLSKDRRRGSWFDRLTMTRRTFAQRWITSPYAAAAASMIASLMVGCGCTVLMISWPVVSSLRMLTHSAISSVTL